ncbi:hypothetical protein GCM10008023_35260 [Sphingomonas glacialis]|uniref:DUF2188 domain-containing protein n=1 Tax=Sphingomonas glacialis TaxID=658225 RepID=A0ABQ3LSW6_9SPHN|nr:hypothetical protein [Sphingomonas glacialis]GHH23826.1 hypothetical protein GCM10008023_35260 [Sphingomonas glacialis]
MTASLNPEPDQARPVLKVGQDRAGHWLVQDSGGALEGRFVSRAAAIGFARSELHAFAGAVIEMAASPLVATISFAPVQPWETARDHRKAA